MNGSIALVVYFLVALLQRLAWLRVRRAVSEGGCGSVVRFLETVRQYVANESPSGER